MSKTVWVLWGSDSETPWMVNIHANKVSAEKDLRYEVELEAGKGYLFWIQEREVIDIRE